MVLFVLSWWFYHILSSTPWFGQVYKGQRDQWILYMMLASESVRRLYCALDIGDDHPGTEKSVLNQPDVWRYAGGFWTLLAWYFCFRKEQSFCLPIRDFSHFKILKLCVVQMYHTFTHLDVYVRCTLNFLHGFVVMKTSAQRSVVLWEAAVVSQQLWVFLTSYLMLPSGNMTLQIPIFNVRIHFRL